jgi:hypothetical protein
MTKNPAVRSYVGLWEVLQPDTGDEKLHIQQDYDCKSYVEETWLKRWDGIVHEVGLDLCN